MDEERFAKQRGRYLAKTTELRKPEANSIAYSELGYSINGMSKHLDTSASTIKDYIERAMALYGLEIAEPRSEFDVRLDYERIEPGYHRLLDISSEKEEWVTFVDRHRNKLPREWVHEVLEEAKKDNVSPSNLASK